MDGRVGRSDEIGQCGDERTRGRYRGEFLLHILNGCLCGNVAQAVTADAVGNCKHPAERPILTTGLRLNEAPAISIGVGVIWLEAI